MKKILTALIAITGIALSQTPTIAQEHEGCFMISEGGKLIDLGPLCPDGRESVETTTKPGVFQVPIKRREGGTPVIDVTFNGNQIAEMLFDTGATGTVITTNLANALGVKQEDTILVNTPSDKGVEMPVGRVASMSAGGAALNNVMVAIAPALDLGLLGQNFFGQYEVTIKQNVIELRPHSDESAQKSEK